VASANLGPLGSREGAPVSYFWTMPNLAPVMLPWMIILALLVRKPNRTAAAWLIWLPPGCVMAFTLTPSLLPSGTDFFLDVITALIIGYAAIWLLADWLRRQHGFLTFLCLLLALLVSSTLAFAFKQGMNESVVDSLQIGILLAIGALVTAVALGLAGLVCRHRYRPVALYLWLFLLVALLWFLVAAPFFAIALISDGGRIPWSAFFIPLFCVATGHFATLLPFLILSSACPFFRERLKALLHVKSEAPAPLNATHPSPVRPLT
jgi:hypothetical protein